MKAFAVFMYFHSWRQKSLWTHTHAHEHTQTSSKAVVTCRVLSQAEATGGSGRRTHPDQLHKCLRVWLWLFRKGKSLVYLPAMIIFFFFFKETMSCQAQEKHFFCHFPPNLFDRVTPIVGTAAFLPALVSLKWPNPTITSSPKHILYPTWTSSRLVPLRGHSCSSLYSSHIITYRTSMMSWAGGLLPCQPQHNDHQLDDTSTVDHSGAEMLLLLIKRVHIYCFCL